MTATEVLAIVAAVVFLISILIPDVRICGVAGLILALAVLAPHLH